MFALGIALVDTLDMFVLLQNVRHWLLCSDIEHPCSATVTRAKYQNSESHRSLPLLEPRHCIRLTPEGSQQARVGGLKHLCNFHFLATLYQMYLREDGWCGDLDR